MKRILLYAIMAFAIPQVNAQCDSVQVPSSYTLASDLILNGTYARSDNRIIRA